MLAVMRCAAAAADKNDVDDDVRGEGAPFPLALSTFHRCSHNFRCRGALVNVMSF